MPNTGNGARMRILDVTAELLLRHGYRRVTIDDIAHHADIGKGTVYLHWKTRDELFRAVFEREGLQALEELIQTLLHDPGAWRLHRLARSYFLAIMRRPLLRGLFLADSELLGKLARPRSGARERRHDLVSQAYIELLAEHGLLRDDLSAEEVAYAFLAQASMRDPVRRVAYRIFLGISGRWFRAYSIVRHVGRTSGRAYQNPPLLRRRMRSIRTRDFVWAHRVEQ